MQDIQEYLNHISTKLDLMVIRITTNNRDILVCPASVFQDAGYKEVGLTDGYSN